MPLRLNAGDLADRASLRLARAPRQRQPQPRFGSIAVVRTVPWVAAAMVLAWGFVGVWSSSAQWGDHFEQFAWAHSIEWGYHKHPPLPTWLLAFAIELFGPSTELAGALALACVLGTGVFTYLVARELLGRPGAALSLLFWGLQHPFSYRCHLFNHNTVLMLAVSATAWCSLRALRDPQLTTRWLALGFVAGLALLSKYQAIVPIAGIACAMWLTGDFASRRVRTGAALAVLVASAMFAPHVVWAMQHDLSTLNYATQQGRTLEWQGRIGDSAGFLAQQTRLVLPALLFAGMLIGMARRQSVAGAEALSESSRRQRAWLIGLVVLPVVVTLGTGLVFGLKLQNHWGYQALQFAGLFLAWRLRSLFGPPRPAWIVLALAVHVAFLVLALMLAKFEPSDRTIRNDGRYPAQELARAVRQDWQDDTSCPLAIVVGPSFEAGMISVYNGGTALVLEDGDFAKSPWITPLKVQRRGAVYVSTDRGKLPSFGVTRVGSLDVSEAAPTQTPRVFWAIQPPVSCGGEMR